MGIQQNKYDRSERSIMKKIKDDGEGFMREKFTAAWLGKRGAANMT
jgi:hypothetical protein